MRLRAGLRPSPRRPAPSAAGPDPVGRWARTRRGSPHCAATEQAEPPPSRRGTGRPAPGPTRSGPGTRIDDASRPSVEALAATAAITDARSTEGSKRVMRANTPMTASVANSHPRGGAVEAPDRAVPARRRRSGPRRRAGASDQPAGTTPHRPDPGSGRRRARSRRTALGGGGRATPLHRSGAAGSRSPAGGRETLAVPHRC